MKKIYLTFLLIFIVLFSSVTFGPIMNHFNRSDVWIAGIPLSQFWILFVCALMAINLAILFIVEVRKGVI